MTGQEKLPDGLECCFKALAKAVFSEEGTVYFHRTFISFDGSDRTRVITYYLEIIEAVAAHSGEQIRTLMSGLMPDTGPKTAELAVLYHNTDLLLREYARIVRGYCADGQKLLGARENRYIEQRREQSVLVAEYVKRRVKPFFAMLNQLLLYAKFDMTMAEGCPDEYLPMLEECIFTIDEVKLERDPQARS